MRTFSRKVEACVVELRIRLLRINRRQIVLVHHPAFTGQAAGEDPSPRTHLWVTGKRIGGLVLGASDCRVVLYRYALLERVYQRKTGQKPIFLRHCSFAALRRSGKLFVNFSGLGATENEYN